MAAVVQIVQLFAGLGACAVVLAKLGLLFPVAGLIQARGRVTCKPCPRCRGPVPVSRRRGSVLGLKLSCPHCDARLVCSPPTRQ
jgi:hypothetical protein